MSANLQYSNLPGYNEEGFPEQSAHRAGKSMPAQSVTGLGATLSMIGAFAVTGRERLGLQLKNISNTITSFEIRVRYGQDGDLIDSGLTIADVNAGVHPVIRSNLPATLPIAVGDYSMEIDVSGYDDIEIWAASTAGTNTVVNGCVQ